MNRAILAFLIVVALAIPASAISDNPISLTIKTEKEITITENGIERTERVPAENIEPGQTLFFTLTYHNNGTVTATNVVFDDPIPEFTSYVENTAYGKSSTITFSVDNGTTFDALAKLKKQGLQDSAQAEDVTHIRWRVESIPPQGKGNLGFQVKVN